MNKRATLGKTSWSAWF